MKKIYLIFFFLTALTSYGQTQYSSNGKTGFGGVVGGSGSLSIAKSGGNITFTLNRGPGDFNDCVVIYIDSKSGGASSTSAYSDQGDDLRKAISGVNGTDRATLDFAANFTPDYAIAFNIGESGASGFGGIWDLSNPTNFTYVTSANLVPDNNRSNATYTVNAAKENIGIPGEEVTFKFLVTYISRTAFRSNEFIGDAGPANNPGFSGYTSTTFQSYPIPVPVRLSNFVASKSGETVNLQWQSEEENNIGRYDVLRSGDAIHFENIGAKNATGSLLKQVYHLVDNFPLSGNNFYKIAVIGKDGSTQYSDVALIKMTNSNFKAYTTSSNKILKINWNNTSNKIYNLMLANQSGQVVFKSTLVPSRGTNSYSFDLGKLLAKGIYSVLLTDGSEKLSQLLLIQ